ncbi:MAG: TetR/AcrR family transcriptional regulator [Myxococcales bacterium]|nr:TetR/AcrR family transcriptional regulator [Myxococcales bacterium]
MSARRINAARKQSKHEAILDAALSAFVERGFHGTAMPEVARRAGVAAGTLYHYVSGKDALVNEVFRRCKESIARVVYTSFTPTAPPRAQFESLWMAMVEFALSNPKAFAFLELHNHESYLDSESRAMDRQLKEFGAGFVRQAQQSGEVRDVEPMLLMELTFGAFNGMMRAHWEGRIALDQRTLDDAREAAWRLIAA